MQLELDKTVIENIAEGSEYLDVGGERRHVIGYLQDFLFSPDRTRSLVGTLSGGERNRLLLARLFAQPANLLVLDEPTNDLDIETLELLEERLLDFGGTVLLVSHDRAFVDNVVTSTLAFEGERPRLRVRRRLHRMAAPAPFADRDEGAPRRLRAARRARRLRRPTPAKLGYKEQREIESLPAQIEALEREQAELGGEVSQPAFYKRDAAEQARVQARLGQLPAELEAAYARWDELEARR